MTTYDEREMPAFVRIEQANRRKLFKIAIAASSILTITGTGLLLSGGGLDLSTPRGLGISGLLLWFMVMAIAPLVAVPFPRHRIVRDKKLDIPQLGGLRRGVVGKSVV